MGTTTSQSFIKIGWKTKKVLLIARFSVQNFKVWVESWKSYISSAILEISRRTASSADPDYYILRNESDFFLSSKAVSIMDPKLTLIFDTKETIRTYFPRWWRHVTMAGRIHLNFHVKFFLHFLLKFRKKGRKNMSWKFMDELSVKYLWIHKWTRWIRP